ncbi:hypothetical protein [Streptomyces bohaiensis]|uniref:DUF3168 domain-containing protein n=1 Tax=Streptomyces bohaiensis TaxID=1431344 RepID=A0ABX1C8E9_9ACTN|nr:hypothetical protein [Streptomyces bohaiensis]NJQ14225.1 hypothetical protein [Streptomyces bohaiensis]
MTGPAHRFPDAARLAVDYLRPLLPGVHVGTAVPRPRLPEMVLLRRIGGSQRNALVDDARLDVQVWAGSDARATELAEEARAHLAAIGRHRSEVRQVDVSTGPTLIPDAPADVPRALMTITLSVRGAAVPT